MGGGAWSSDFYRDQEEVRKRSGRSTFSYDASLATRARHEREVHASLNPKGVTFRESRDNEEHPESNAVAVFFDVTGSMHSVPRVLQEKLPNLMDTLNASGYIKDPQVFFGAVGDSVSDRGPLQVGQFESDNRVIEAFENMWLEGGGGYTCEESYQNALYFAARHMELDCVEKRNKKGYLFLIGDEMPYLEVRAKEINRLMGEGTLQDDIPLADILAEAQAKFNVYMIIPTATSHGNDPRVQDTWRKLLGQNVLLTDNIEGICEIIAMTVGVNEGVSFEQAREDLQKHGSTEDVINRASASLVSVAAAAADAPRSLRI